MPIPKIRPAHSHLMCKATVEGKPCTYPRLTLPSGATSPLCYWHRISRTAMDAQITEANLRLQEAPQPHRPRAPIAEWPSGERWCAGCQTFVPLWYCRASRCRACASKSQRESYRLAKYGLSLGQTDAIRKTQGDRCAICRKRQRDRTIATDHDHKTGRVRGMLCTNCNHKLLGGAFDSPRMLLAALVYLTVPPTSGNWLPPEEYGDRLMKAWRRAVGAALEAAERGKPTEDDGEARE